MSTASPRKHRPSTPSRQALVFEVAWEICQQLGGIYTVMRTKVPAMKEHLGDRYVMVGPYSPRLSPMEFEPAEPEGMLSDAIERLAGEGVKAHFGYWLCTGRPAVVLLDIATDPKELESIKYHYWRNHSINLPGGDQLLDNVLVFGDRVRAFFKAVAEAATETPLLAHFHEWMSSTAIAEIRRLQLPVATVFTTHATLLGRHLAMRNPWFYNSLETTNWLQEAQSFGIETQVRLERTAATHCTTFTTVSEVTGQECQYLLGRKPDVILPNGLNIERYAAVHEFQNLHRINKERLHQFVMGHFFPSYTFDLETTSYFFTSGRYEYHNKGFDLTLEALSRLNLRLRQANSDRTVVFFLVTRRDFHSINPDVLNRRAMMEEMRNTCEEVQRQVGERLFQAVAARRSPSLDSLVDERWKLRLRQFMYAWQTEQLPPIVTHNLHDDRHDQVLNQLRASNLINLPEDRVKVVYHPDFVTPSSPLFGMDYPQFVRGCHMGIFPSCYEPWGYTPMECVASGIPAITSDFSGFGAYLLNNLPTCQRNGLYVVRRRNLDFAGAADDLADYLWRYLKMGLRDRITMRNRVEAFSENFGWVKLVKFYLQAHDDALRKEANGGA